MECEMSNKEHCPDCGVAPGKEHLNGCDIEQCPRCGWQLISCCCNTDAFPPMKWTGLPFTVEACRKLGWYAKLVDNVGWVPCDPDDNDATEDVNRLYRETQWDSTKRMFVRPTNGSRP